MQNTVAIQIRAMLNGHFFPSKLLQHSSVYELIYNTFSAEFVSASKPAHAPLCK